MNLLIVIYCIYLVIIFSISSSNSSCKHDDSEVTSKMAIGLSMVVIYAFLCIIILCGAGAAVALTYLLIKLKQLKRSSENLPENYPMNNV